MEELKNFDMIKKKKEAEEAERRRKKLKDDEDKILEEQNYDLMLKRMENERKLLDNQ